MKKLKLIVLLIIISKISLAQQILSVIKDKKDTAGKSLDFKDQDKVFILGTGTTDALELNKLTAAGGLNIVARPIKKLSLSFNFNYAGKIVSKEKADSVYLSSLYFPDIGSTAFAGSANFSLLPWKFKSEAEHQLLITLDGSVQERNIDRDTVVFNLSVANFNLGPKYQWYHKNKNNENDAIITFGVFYNHVFINDNSKKDFNALFNPSGQTVAMPSDLQGVNGLISVQFNSALVYFRTYTDLNRGRDLSFTVGIKAVGKFFSF